MKKICFYILILLSLTSLSVKADTCNDYELRVRDSLGKEEILKCYTDYNEAKKAMNEYDNDDKHFSVLYKNDNAIPELSSSILFVSLDFTLYIIIT